MEIGTGITVGCTILGGVAIVFKLWGTKKYLPEDVFSIYKEGVETHMKLLCKGIKEVKTGINEIHKRIDKLIERGVKKR